MGFDSFLGNPKAVRALREMLTTGRVPGSLLFCGPDGVGKKTLALMFAKVLNCERRRDDFCAECRSCRRAEEMLAASREDLERRRQLKDSQRRVEGLIYFDLQLIEPLTRYILIEQVRQIRNTAYTRPFELSRRVFVIDQAQSIHWQAIDLLLKVLEEPPETTTFVLITPNAFELRPTIRSRCSQVQFLPVEDEIIGRVLGAEGLVGKVQQGLAVRAAAGSIAKARAFDVEDFERRRRPWADYLEGVASTSAGAKAGLDWSKLFDAARSLAEDRERFDETLRIGYTLLGDLLQVLEGSDRVVNVDLLPRLKIWAPKLGLKRLERLRDGLDQAYRQQIRNVNQQLGFETLAMDVSAAGGEGA